ncbi:MAG: L,D-transpeptidase family protein [Bacteroidales bacterium]
MQISSKISFAKLCVVLFSCLFISLISKAAATERQSIVAQFYTAQNESIYWLSSSKRVAKASEWLKAIDAADNLGIVSNNLLNDQIRAVLKSRETISNETRSQTDKLITTVILKFIQTLQEGNIVFAYNEVSTSHDSDYIQQLLQSQRRSVPKLVAKLDCKDAEYLTLKRYLHDSLPALSTDKFKALAMAMNYRRFLSINQEVNCIVVNIPEAEAIYYKENKPILTMRTVVGKKSNPTPTIASHITSIVTFPYWNVPHSIAVKEILPKVQKDDNYLEQNNFEVVDAKNNVVDDADLNWKKYDADNFPYFFRQSTGAGNSLGVLKFNLENPFSIFLHATSWQGVFEKENRFLSHGCIRLEKPFDLANELMNGKLDIEKLKSDKENTEPKTYRLDAPLQTFIIYNLVQVNGKKITFLDDVYKLVK